MISVSLYEPVPETEGASPQRMTLVLVSGCTFLCFYERQSLDRALINQPFLTAAPGIPAIRNV